MNPKSFNLLLADDDQDDCMFFQEALEELPITAKLTTVTDGVQLLNLLHTPGFILPDALYLDLNMPRKSGLDCLTEIKQHEKFKLIPIIVFTTSFNKEVADVLYGLGANYFIQKPAAFAALKNIIAKSLELVSESSHQQTPKENFVITAR